MALYREVKASKRLPDRDGRYSVKYKKGFGPITNPYDYMYFDPLNPQWKEIEAWLEPIEITEEGYEAAEWAANHIKNSVYSSVLNELTVAYRAGFNAALSKLKGE